MYRVLLVMSQTVGDFSGWSRLACAAELCICTALSVAEMFEKPVELCTRADDQPLRSNRQQQKKCTQVAERPKTYAGRVAAIYQRVGAAAAAAAQRADKQTAHIQTDTRHRYFTLYAKNAGRGQRNIIGLGPIDR